MDAETDRKNCKDLHEAGMTYIRRHFGIWRPPLSHHLRKASDRIPIPLRKRLVMACR